MTPPFHLDLAKTALFLDFDGVLVDIAPTPDAVRVSAGLRALLAALDDRTGGALAIVTGRAIADLRRYLPQSPRRVIGSHGAERDLGTGVAMPHPLADSAQTRAVQAQVADLAAQSPGLLSENKPTGAVLHFRQAPDWGARARTAMQAIAAEVPAFVLHPAKMAFELRPADVGKDRAVADLMGLSPFLGRQPVYFGDDVTDEPAMAWVLSRGGRAVKVGEGDSVAPDRLAGPAQVHALLDRWRRMGPDNG